MREQDSRIDEALAGVDESKRATLMRLIGGSAFAAPVVAAFAMQGLSIRPTHAAPIGASSNATATSDIRLKREIVRIGSDPRGFGIYRFKYLWSDAAYVGVMAQEVRERVPSAVLDGAGGYLAVDYDALGVRFAPAQGPAGF